MSVARVVQRGQKFDDTGCANKWKWEWVSAVVNVNGDKQRVGTRFRKIDVRGSAWCTVCDTDVSYASRGLQALTDHLRRKKHVETCSSLKDNQRLPGTESEDITYGVNPAEKAATAVTTPQKSVPLTSVKDRTSNLEAMTLAFAAEKGLSLSAVPDLINFVKAASCDKAALNDLSMDRTTASYKLRGGLAPFLQESLLEELRITPFSLNIDEATSKTNQKVLGVLVSHFSPSANRVMVNHLDAIIVTKVTAENLFAELDKLFVKHRLNWGNLVSVLMDSCAVMRGCKGGLETLIRRRVPGLLDIDGDTCHHAHNAAKLFCKPFAGEAEALMADLHTDFKWSADLKEKLFDICHILGIKATSPERYVSHRWLSVLDVALDTVRLFDAYTVFYWSYLRLEDRQLCADIVEEIMQRRQVSVTGKESIAEIQLYLRKKFSGFTKQGKERKARLVEKCFESRIEILATLHVYTSVLPILQKYVLFFQRKEPAMHRLHDKQHELFNEFCKSFLTPECLQKMPHQVHIEDEKNLKSEKHMFVPMKAADLLNSKEGLSHKKNFIHKLKTAYISCALSLQKKMPVNNPVLKACAGLDPSVRRTSTAQQHLKALSKMRSIVGKDDEENFVTEVDTYSTSPAIPTAAPGTSIDVFWAQMDRAQFPLLTEIARKLLSAFHGPAVEASFSTMGDILNSGSSRMDIGTYAAIQTVRYSLAAKESTAVGVFSKKNPVQDPVPKQLTQKMQKAWTVNEERKEENKEKDMETILSLGAPVQKPATKTAEKQRILEEAQKERERKRKRPAAEGQSTSLEPERERQESRTVSDLPAAKKIQKTLACFFRK